MVPKAAVVLFGCALLAASGVAFGATGEYQQTRDGKTTVWNGSPKSGESASWAGPRDKEGYATGFGTITWYSANGTVNAVYYGNMVNGKLEGPVNAHMGRRTAHAYFADGGRATAWARGPAPSKMNVPEDLVTKRRKAESEQPKPREERAEAKKETTEKRARSSEIVRPIEQPQKPVVAETKPKMTPAATPVEENIQVPTPEPSVAPTSSPAIAETTTLATPEPTQNSSSLFESTPAPNIAQAPPDTMLANQTPQVTNPEPSTPAPSAEQKPETVEQSPAEEPAKKSETGSDGSIGALAGPPSSLRGNSIPESKPSSKSETTTRSTSAGTRGVAQLSEDDVIGLADVEAREHGYDLNEYQRPKADYSAVKDKWSLFYNLKDPKVAGGDLQPFSVTVEDKTKKIEIRRNY
jgi:hypothetical protein